MRSRDQKRHDSILMKVRPSLVDVSKHGLVNHDIEIIDKWPGNASSRIRQQTKQTRQSSTRKTRKFRISSLNISSSSNDTSAMSSANSTRCSTSSGQMNHHHCHSLTTNSMNNNTHAKSTRYNRNAENIDWNNDTNKPELLRKMEEYLEYEIVRNNIEEPLIVDDFYSSMDQIKLNKSSLSSQKKKKKGNKHHSRKEEGGGYGGLMNEIENMQDINEVRLSIYSELFEMYTSCMKTYAPILKKIKREYETSIKVLSRKCYLTNSLITRINILEGKHHQNRLDLQNEMQQIIQEKNQEIVQLKNEISQIHQQYNEIEQLNMQRIKEKTVLEKEIAFLKRSRDTFYDEMKFVENEIDNVNDQCEQANKRAESKDRQLNRMTLSLQNVSDELETTQKKLALAPTKQLVDSLRASSDRHLDTAARYKSHYIDLMKEYQIVTGMFKRSVESRNKYRKRVSDLEKELEEKMEEMQPDISDLPLDWVKLVDRGIISEKDLKKYITKDPQKLINLVIQSFDKREQTINTCLDKMTEEDRSSVLKNDKEISDFYDLTKFIQIDVINSKLEIPPRFAIITKDDNPKIIKEKPLSFVEGVIQPIQFIFKCIYKEFDEEHTPTESGFAKSAIQARLKIDTAEIENKNPLTSQIREIGNHGQFNANISIPKAIEQCFIKDDTSSTITSSSRNRFWNWLSEVHRNRDNNDECEFLIQVWEGSISINVLRHFHHFIKEILSGTDDNRQIRAEDIVRFRVFDAFTQEEKQNLLHYLKEDMDRHSIHNYKDLKYILKEKCSQSSLNWYLRKQFLEEWQSTKTLIIEHLREYGLTCDIHSFAKNTELERVNVHYMRKTLETRLEYNQQQINRVIQKLFMVTSIDLLSPDVSLSLFDIQKFLDQNVLLRKRVRL